MIGPVSGSNVETVMGVKRPEKAKSQSNEKKSTKKAKKLMF